MPVTKLSGSLRLTTGALLVLSVAAAGYQHRSAASMLPLALAFTAAYVTGKWRVWRPLLAQGQTRRVVTALATTLLIQLALVAVLFLCGFGLGALLRQTVTQQLFGSADVLWATLTGAFGVGMGFALHRLEQRPTEPDADHPSRTEGTSDGMTDNPTERAELRVSPEPLAPHTFFSGIHYSHGYSAPPEGKFDATPNEQSAGTAAKIAAAEARLGVQLPEALRTLYLVQNGGSVRNVCVPKPGIATPSQWQHIDTPFGGYDDLYPTETLRTVFDSITDFADPDTEADRFPPGCKQMVVLAQWYQQTLLLDYTRPGEPTVVFADLDHPRWQAEALRWPSFAAFFASLRRYETVD